MMHLFWGRSLFKIPMFYYLPPTRENERGKKFPKNLGIPFFTLGVSEMRPIIGPTTPTPKNTPRKCTQKNAAAAMIAGFSFLSGRFPSKNSAAATTLLVGCANGQVGKNKNKLCSYIIGKDVKVLQFNGEFSLHFFKCHFFIKNNNLGTL